MRLIDADKLLDALGIFNDREHGNEHFMNGIETAREIVQSAKAVECRNCAHYRAESEYCEEWLKNTTKPGWVCFEWRDKDETD